MSKASWRKKDPLRAIKGKNNSYLGKTNHKGSRMRGEYMAEKYHHICLVLILYLDSCGGSLKSLRCYRYGKIPTGKGPKVWNRTQYIAPETTHGWIRTCLGPPVTGNSLHFYVEEPRSIADLCAAAWVKPATGRGISSPLPALGRYLCWSV